MTPERKRAIHAKAKLKWFHKNKDRINARKRERYNTVPSVREKALRYTRLYRTNNKLKVLESTRNSAKKLRLEVLERYGGLRCACCAETIEAFLCIDHINNDGGQHRKTFTTSFYNWLRNNQYPPGFQVLCYNCNNAKRTRGQCPHTMMGRA